MASRSEALLSANRASLGTKEALAAVHTVALEGVIVIDEMPGIGAVSEFLAADGRAFLSTQLPGMGAVDQGCDGSMYWEEDMRLGARRRDDVQADIARRKYGTLRHAPWKELYVRAELLGTEQVEGRSCHLLAMIPKLGHADRWYLDTKTSRLVRFSMKIGGTTQEPIEFVTTLSDWRAVGGVLYPHMRVAEAGETRVTRTLTSIRHEPELADGVYQAPANLTGGRALPGDFPRLRALAKQTVASVRLTCRPQEVGAQMGAAVSAVAHHVEAKGWKAAGPPFTRYHSFGAEAIEIEAGIPLEGSPQNDGADNAKAGAADVHLSSLPAGRVLSVWHYGPLDRVALSYAKLETALQEFGLEANGGQWEVYWSPPGREDQEMLHRTQLVVPVKVAVQPAPEPKEQE